MDTLPNKAEMAPIPLSDKLETLFRIEAQRRVALERLLFTRYPRREWGTFFLFGFRKTSWGMALSFVESLPPLAGDLDRSSGIVEFRTQYIARAKDEAERGHLALGVIHSHPENCRTSPSGLDNDMDRYFSEFLSDFLPGRPYASLIMARTTSGEVSFSGRAFDGKVWMPVTELLTPGRDVLKREHSQIRTVNVVPTTDRLYNARSSELYGDRATARIRGAKVAVIGASGTGSPAIEMLTRAGLGKIVTLDKDVLSPSNSERLHGSRHSDYKGPYFSPKVEIAQRHVQEISADTEIVALSASILDDTVLDQVLQCDLVLNCTDTQHSRAFLTHLTGHYLIPCLDMGVLMESQEGRLTTQKAEWVAYWPDGPCPLCDGRINWTEVNQELMPEEEKQLRMQQAEQATKEGGNPDQYWRKSPKLLAVGYLTTMVGSLATGYALHWLTGMARMPADWFQIDVGYPQLGYLQPERKINSACCCRLHQGWADQAVAMRLIGIPGA